MNKKKVNILFRKNLKLFTTVLQPASASTMDTFIQSDNATYANGVVATIVTGGLSTGGQVCRGLLRFDLSSIPSNAKIISASISLYHETEAATTDYTVGLHKALTEWFESEVTGALNAGDVGSVWNYRNNAGTVAWAGGAGGGSGSDYMATASDTKLIAEVLTWYSFDVTNDVAGFIVSNNFGWWVINESEATANSRKRFTSSDAVTGTDRPKITVVYKA